MMMNMIGLGLDINNEDEVDGFLENYNRNLLQDLDLNENAPRLVTDDPFKHLGRNEKITVKYTDGKIYRRKNIDRS